MNILAYILLFTGAMAYFFYWGNALTSADEDSGDQDKTAGSSGA